MTKVLFVCLGNICRSPMAEGLLRKRAAEKGIDLQVDSAATGRWNLGNPPHEGTQAILDWEGVDTAGMRARLVESADFQEFDYIIGMDENNRSDLLAIAPVGTEAKVYSYMSVVPGKEHVSIPDPWYTGNFDETFQLISEGLDPWLAKFSTEA